MNKLFVFVIILASVLLAQGPVSRDNGCSAAGASGTTYTCSMSPSPGAYTTGNRYAVKADVINTGAVTWNLNSLGAKSVVRTVGGITTALVARDISAGAWLELVYDGTNLQCQSGCNGNGQIQRRVCSIVIGADNGSALVTADIAPQGRQCFVPYAGTVIEITVAADAGTPAVVVAKNSAGTLTSLSASLATAASGGLACANAAGSGTGIDGATTCAVQITTTALAAGDWLETRTSASASTAKRMSIDITYTIP